MLTVDGKWGCGWIKNWFGYVEDQTLSNILCNLLVPPLYWCYPQHVLMLALHYTEQPSPPTILILTPNVLSNLQCTKQPLQYCSNRRGWFWLFRVTRGLSSAKRSRHARYLGLCGTLSDLSFVILKLINYVKTLEWSCWTPWQEVRKLSLGY